MKFSLKTWLFNARSISLVQSAMPAILAVVLAIGDADFQWWCAIFAVLGVLAAHLAMNLADDYFDYKVDMLGDRYKVQRQGFRAMMHKYPYLTDGSQTLKSTAVAIACFILFALFCGTGILVSKILTGPQLLWPMFAIVGACGFLGVFYSGPPFKLAYRGLGEPVIGIIFGPLLMLGVYYACCAKIAPEVVFLSVPVGLLVLNILFTHSFIDMKGDEQCNKMTLARLLSSTKANLIGAAIFIFGPFVMLVLGVLLGSLNVAYLVVLLVLPRGAWLFKSLLDFSKGCALDMERPPKWLGPFKDWDKYKVAGIDWFMARWLCARNLLSGFCALSMLVSILTKLL